MQTLMDESIIIEKTRDLCQAIISQPSFRTVRQQIDAFLANEEAKMLYQLLSERSEYLQHKQAQGAELSNDEIADYEQQRETFINNPVARGFLDAQQEVQKVQQSVNQYVTKTFELGRLPEPADFDSGSCGHGCGCSH